MFLSITCAEDLPRIDADSARELAEGTFLGGYRYERQTACSHWPRRPPPASYTSCVATVRRAPFFTEAAHVAAIRRVFPLTPVSESRFVPRALPPGYTAGFEPEHGSVRALLLEGPGMARLRLDRKK